MRWKRVITRTSLVIIVTFAGLVLLMDSCMQFRMSKTEIDDFFKNKMYTGTEYSYYVGRQKINYIVAGNDSLPLLIFVHGSPGSLSAFIDFMDDTVLLKKVQMISVDRPGFGASNFGYAEPSLEKQVQELKPILLKHKNNRPVYLLGHSLGGPVIARMAIDYPELVDGLIFVAASNDPQLEPNEWFRGPLATPFLKWAMPRSLRASNDEIYQLKPQLEAMIPLWKNITCKSIFIQGDSDELVPKENADFTKKMLVNAPCEVVMYPGMNHFVPWSHPFLIENAILYMAENKTGPMSVERPK
ncbi:MAG: alpha/beta hydrolase, partial [Bacteroidota bacterium]